MRYTVLRIDEDLDFGCEERVEGTPIMAVVTLIDENGNKVVLRYPDQQLYDKDINENDEVFLSENQEIYKIIKGR